ncbi:MAG: metal ABC transporter ATP-binding protein [Verrucomicrobia bacterium]|nr:metal ABC transporter ATP-binding protein [Verrucomicrobiota bacterium]
MNMDDREDAFLTLEGLAVGYGRQPVLENVNLRFPQGCFYGLLGANGSGKSTLIRTLLGIIPPLSGRMVFRPMNGLHPVLGYVPQRESLDPIFLLSSYEVVLMGVCGRVGPGRFIDKSERAWAHQCLEQTGAADLSGKQFSELSGGQKQRVLIARALATKPDFLLLDEPTSGIDVAVKQSIMELLQRIHAEQRQTILMASHDLPVVRQYIPHVIWLRPGQILEGPAAELLARDQMEALLELEMR